jgi:DNA modification methylase
MTATTKPPIAIEHVAIDDLRPDPANPRRISDAELESLTRSIREYGLIHPIIARRDDKTVIGGHQRLLAARRLGLKTVPVIYVDLTQEQARVLNLALNKLTLTGFDEGELDKLLKTLDVREKREKAEVFDVDAALEAARAATRAQRGDLWALGDHRLLIGDATDAGVVSRLLGEIRPAMCFTDPPYNVDYCKGGGSFAVRRNKRTIQNDCLSPEDWDRFVRGWAGNLLAAVDGARYICMSTREWPTMCAILADLGAHWSDSIIWAKDRFLPGRADYPRSFEPVFCGWRERAKHQWHGGRTQDDVWRIERPSDSDAHPTMKPLALVEKAITNSSKPGDVVLDLFLGSGTTLIAAERTGRVCYGMRSANTMAAWCWPATKASAARRPYAWGVRDCAGRPRLARPRPPARRRRVRRLLGGRAVRDRAGNHRR